MSGELDLRDVACICPYLSSANPDMRDQLIQDLCHAHAVDVLAAVEQIITARLDEYKARAVAAIEARMGRDANYDDGMEDAARIIRDLT